MRLADAQDPAAAAREAFLARARERLRPEPPPGSGEDVRGDHDLNAGVGRARDPKSAAVLVPVVARPEGLTLLLTERAGGLRSHSGQIALPGGRIDPDDGAPLAAALREAREEIGLDPRFVAPLGYCDAYLSFSGYLVTPVVGLVREGFSLALNRAEVADAFEVPLAHLMDEANHELHVRPWNGRLRRYYVMRWDGRIVWGVTAGILRRLYERLHAPTADGSEERR